MYRSALIVSSIAAVGCFKGRYLTTMMGSSSSFKHGVLTADQAPAAAALISDAFPLSSPHSWARALSMDSNMKPYLTNYLEKQLLLTESYGLEDPESKGRLVGCVILELHKWKPKGNEHLSSDIAVNDIQWEREKGGSDTGAEYTPYGAIEGILEECEVQLYKAINGTSRLDRLRKDFLERQYGYVAWMATSEQYRKQGIASKLVEVGTKGLAANGCTLAVAYCVSPSATRVFQQQGYELVGRVVYADYEYMNRRPFSILPDEISIMVKVLI